MATKKKSEWQEDAMRALGLLTPSDVAKIAKFSSGVLKVPLITVMEKGDQFLFSELEKAAQNKGKKAEKDSAQVVELKDYQEGKLKQKPTLEELEEKEEKSTDEELEQSSHSASIMLITERRKFKQKCKKMRESDIYKSYEKSASIDIESNKEKSKKFSVSFDSGVLVNKKQS